MACVDAIACGAAMACADRTACGDAMASRNDMACGDAMTCTDAMAAKACFEPTSARMRPAIIKTASSLHAPPPATYARGTVAVRARQAQCGAHLTTSCRKFREIPRRELLC